ncbi:MAG TPA: response regulator transcription factor [Dermatophilaceae bacterium]|nr:response regulator transcription factor [Dermatophilaceae bacterium]
MTALLEPGWAASSQCPVKVLIVDDSDVVRMGLRSLLEAGAGLMIVGEARNGEQAVELTRKLQPDVVLLDVRMPHRDGVSVVGEISEFATVIMLTFSDEPEVVRGAVAAGASGYLVHGMFDAGTLAQTVRGAASGNGAFTAGALDALRPSLRLPPTATGLRAGDHDLTQRQVEVMEVIAAGRTNPQIAHDLCVSEKTVKNHINQIFARLGVGSRAEAIAVWLGTTTPEGR